MRDENDLVLQARVQGYKESDLYNLLYKEHKLVDGFDKEMCIYESGDFARFSFVRNEYFKQVVPTLKYTRTACLRCSTVSTILIN